MKVIYIIITLMSIQSLSGQNKFSIDLVGGPDYSFRNLIANSESQSVSLVLRSRDQEIGKIKYRIGFNMNARLTTKTWFKSGIRYINGGYIQTDKKDLRWPAEFDPSGVYLFDPSLPHELKLTKTHHFLEIPLMVRQEFGVGLIKPFVELGVSPLVYLRTTDRAATEFAKMRTSSDNTDIGYKRIYYSINLSFGATYELNPKYKIFLQPVFRYHGEALEEGDIEEYLYSFGLEMGLRRNFGKASNRVR